MRDETVQRFGRARARVIQTSELLLSHSQIRDLLAARAMWRRYSMCSGGSPLGLVNDEQPPADQPLGKIEAIGAAADALDGPAGV